MTGTSLSFVRSHIGNRPMQNISLTPLVISLLFLSACAPAVHKDFLQNVAKSQKTDGSRPRVVVSLKYSEKEKYLLVGHESGTIDIWDATKAESMREIKAHAHRANSLVFTTDGKAFFSNSYFENDTKLWSLRTGKLLSSIAITKGPVSVTSDTRFYIVANSEELRIFDYQNMALLPEKFKFSYDVVTSIAFDSSTNKVAIGTASGTIQLLNFLIKEGTPTLTKVSDINPYSIGNKIIALQFYDKGRSLYSVASSGSIDEWSTQPLKIKRSLSTALKGIYAATFMPDKGLLALSGTGESIYPASGTGYLEIISLANDLNSAHKLSTNYPGPIEFLSPFSSVISAESYSMEIYPLPQEK